MGRRKAPPRVGITVVEGPPGSGKSLRCVELVLGYVLDDLRPVYTNLPLRWRVWRRWLRARGGVELANLVRPISEDQFRRFLARANAKRRFIEEIKQEHGGSARYAEAERLFCEKFGPDIETGRDMNWIPAWSVIVIDEAHHWFSSAEQAARKETPDLLGYLTMHRHHVHECVFATQSKAQISVNIRRQASDFWTVRDIASIPVLFNLRPSQLGLRMLEYAQYNAVELAKDQNTEHAPAVKRYWVPPFLPQVAWKFRLYDSYTHAGSQAQLQKGLERVRERAGVAHLAAPKEPEPEEAMGKPGRWRKCFAFACVGLVAGAALGRLIPHRAQQAVPAQVPAVPVPLAPPVPAQVPAIPPGPKWVVSGVSGDSAFVGRVRVNKGASHDGYLLEDVRPDGSSLWRRLDDGRLFVASRGASLVLAP